MKDELRIKLLLTRYLANQCSPAELDELFAALATEPGQAVLGEYLDQETATDEKMATLVDAAASARIFRRLSASIEASEAARPIPLFSRRLFWQMAAAFVGILLLAGAGYYNWHKADPLTIATDAGQKRTVILPDGSRAILNANSTLTYDGRWRGDAARRVTLEGEAFFDITHDAAHPFYVKTSRLEIKVLGTTFNVKSDRLNKIFETTLIRGKVVVRDLDAPTRPETVLKPAQKAVFGQELAAAAIQTVPAQPDDNSYWNKGRLVFEDEPIAVIARELEKWYGVKIKVAEASKDCRFYLNVENETLPEVLELFEAVSGVKSEVNGNSVTLNGSLCDKN